VEINLDDWDKLPAQKLIYEDTQSKILTLSGGLGCVHEQTLIDTIFGKRKVKEISRSFFVHSVFEGRPCVALSTAPYQKGEDDLLLVSSEQGEFVAHESHRICVENGIYQPLSLCASSQTFLHPLYSNLASYPQVPYLGVRHLMRKAQDFEFDCLGYTRFYGEQLLQALSNVQDSLPLFFDALALYRSSFEYFGHSDDFFQHLYKHSHLSQAFDLLSIQDCTLLRVVLDAALEYQDFFSKHLGHIWGLRQEEMQFMRFFSLHLKYRESSLSFSRNEFLVDAFSSCKINTIEKREKAPFFDMHVFFSNNYNAEGFNHHNSGKSHVGVRKAIQLSALNAGYSGGFLCPSYSDFRKDIKPLFEEILEEHMGLQENVHWWFHKTQKEYRFIWNKKPLYIFTGESPIAGPNLAYCIINEYSLMKWERINEMLRRVRVAGAKYKQKVLVGTPEDVHGWLEEFIDNQQTENDNDPNHFKLVYADTRENRHVDSDYRRQLELMLDDQQLKVFAGGQIVKIGSDYFYYSYSDTDNVEDIQEDPTLPVYVGLDFNVGKMCASFNQIKYINGVKKLFCFDELKLTGDSNTYTMRDALLARYPKERMIITCDASGKNRSTTGIQNLLSDVAILRDKGLNVRYKTVNLGMRTRQLLMNGLFYNKHVIISPKCKQVRRDFKTVKQDKATFEKDKKNDDLTHFSDGLDYLCDYEFKLPERAKPSPASVSRYN
jgi:hypothetical protein